MMLVGSGNAFTFFIQVWVFGVLDSFRKYEERPVCCVLKIQSKKVENFHIVATVIISSTKHSVVVSRNKLNFWRVKMGYSTHKTSLLLTSVHHQALMRLNTNVQQGAHRNQQKEGLLVAILLMKWWHTAFAHRQTLSQNNVILFFCVVIC